MKFALDSADFPDARRMEAWRGILCDTYVGMDVGFEADGFRSQITGCAVGDHAFTRVEASSPYHVDRSRTLIKRDGLEVLFFGFVHAGRFVMTQSGRETTVEPGIIAFNDATRPFRTHFGRGVKMGWLALPKKALEDRIGSCEDLTATAFRTDTPVQKIAFDFVSGLGDVLNGGVNEATAAALMDQAADLLAMMVSGETSIEALRLARMRRVKAYIEDHLHCNDLTKRSAAAALSLSRREIDALFAAEDTTFDLYLQACRLDGVYAFLGGAGLLSLSVGDIAEMWGFAHTDGFDRMFSDRFGLDPRDVPGQGSSDS